MSTLLEAAGLVCKTCILCSGIALVSMLMSIACVWTYLVKCETLSGADPACRAERLPSLKIQKML